MSRKSVSSKERDPCLTEGRGYFVDDEKLAAHLEEHKGKPQEVCHQVLIGLIWFRYVKYSLAPASLTMLSIGPTLEIHVALL